MTAAPRRVIVVLVVALLLVAVAAGWGGAVAEERAEPDQAQLCRRYESLVAALLHTSPASQAARVQRAESLAALAARFPSTPQPQSDPVPVAGQRLRAALNRPYVTVADLFAAARPVAVACGVDWRTGWTGHLLGGRSDD